MPKTFSTGLTVPSSGDQHPSAEWWDRIGATANAAILNAKSEAITTANTELSEVRDRLPVDYVPRAEASQYGIPGPANELGIGTVAPGETAAASFTGDAPTQLLNLTLPRGERGPQGPGGAISLVETDDPGLFVESSTVWAQWDNTAGSVARMWNPGTGTYTRVFGDTGERNITARATGTNTGAIYLSRFGQWVQLSFDGLTLTPPDGTSFRVVTDLLPAGFRPPRFQDFRSAPRSTTEYNNTIRVEHTGNITAYSYTGQIIRGVVVFRTPDAWPATLPGAAA